MSRKTAKALGKLPAKNDVRALLFARFVGIDTAPVVSLPWKGRAAFPARSFGNRDEGCCTRASQAVLAMRMERVEQRRTPKVTDAEVHRVYRAMTERLYGGGDTGGYETDALSEWRRPEYTFRDTAGRALTIDAYTRVNHLDLDEVRVALYVTKARGAKLCLSLPRAFSRIDPPATWDVPEGQPLIGPWEPNSWGGHSLTCDGYDRDGVWLVHTWYDGGVYRQLLTWRAFAAYCDEFHVVIDSANAWKKRLRPGVLDVAGIVKAVNKVSSYPVAA